MAYDKFKLKDIKPKFDIQNFNREFIAKNLPDFEVSQRLYNSISETN